MGNDNTAHYKRLTLAEFAGPCPLVRDDKEGSPVDAERKEAA